MLKKVGWFFGLWLAGVMAVGAIALVIRLALHP